LKTTEISPISDNNKSNEIKNTLDKGGEVYLSLTSIHSNHDVWLIDLGAYFHMTPYKEWFCEYELYERGYVFLGDDSKTKIVG
jgi:hypothetical protein